MPVAIRADSNQIQQVLINLAINARDAMPSGGTMRISTRRITTSHPGPIVTVTPAPSCIRIVVQDTGVGMAPEVQTRIFEPFFTTKAVGQGTGLGLSTSYGIVAQHGGRIAVRSRVGEGSAFTIDLPIVDAFAEAAEQQTSFAGLPGGSETILVVEDEEVVRVFVERVLRALGCVVFTAPNGLDALQFAYRGVPFDLLLTDMVMPELHGTALAARLVARQPGLRVIYMSGYPEHPGSVQETMTQGTLLPKPFTGSVLAHLVRTVLDQPVGS